MDRFNFRHSVAVRFSDLDVLGHVNHLAYLDYLESARVTYYLEVMGVESAVNIRFVLADLRVRYRAPVLFGQTLEVAFGLTWLKRSSSGFAYQIRDQATGELVAEGEGIQVYVDPATGRGEALPEVYRQRIEAHEGRSLLPPEP